jgi:hypothetical protein
MLCNVKDAMQPSPPQFPARAIRLSLQLGAAALAFGLFVSITHELLEQEVSGVDRTILLAFARVRTPWLTVMAVDLTALGSITLIVVISTVASTSVLNGGHQRFRSNGQPALRSICGKLASNNTFALFRSARR